MFNILKIFKVAEDLDLGCGVGGGKDSKDIFKVGIVTGSLSTRLRRGFCERGRKFLMKKISPICMYSFFCTASEVVPAVKRWFYRMAWR